MTREEAIKMLKSKMDGHTDTPYEWAETVRMSIEALEQEPCGKDINVPTTDAISRQAVLDGVDRYIYKSQSTGTQDDFYSFAELVVKQLPSVTPQQKTGHWIFDEILDKHYYCSECKSMGVDYWDYCPNCGAKMVEPQESEDNE